MLYLQLVICENTCRQWSLVISAAYTFIPTDMVTYGPARVQYVKVIFVIPRLVCNWLFMILHGCHMVSCYLIYFVTPLWCVQITETLNCQQVISKFVFNHAAVHLYF